MVKRVERFRMLIGKPGYGHGRGGGTGHGVDLLIKKIIIKVTTQPL
jgi:Xaa-Pro aminopeptidase